MAKLEWDKETERTFETGVDRGVLYVKGKAEKASDNYEITGVSLGKTTVKSHYKEGVVWNGLTSVTENPGGAEANDIFADNIKYASIRSAETFGGTIEAYMYPDAFKICDGSKEVATGVYVGQQNRTPFGFAFRTDKGDASDNGIDVNNNYKLHLVYGATASPSQSQYSTINESPEAITFSWEFSTIPTSAGAAYKPTSLLTIDSSKLDADGKTKLTALEDVLYGTDGQGGQGGNTGHAGYLPDPDQIVSYFAAKT